MEKLIFEKSSPGRKGYSLPPLDVSASPLVAALPEEYRRKKDPLLPEVSEVEVIRHYTRLSQHNYGLDVGFYPLGSCSMKYNPKVNEDMAKLPGFLHSHPLQPEEISQGALRLIWDLEHSLTEISGMERVSLQPAAGAQGEMVGMLIVRTYHEANGRPRKKVIIPDSAHGTNPASATLAGYQVQVVRSNAEGLVDIDDLQKVVDSDCAALMLTNPNTLGLFEREIEKITKIIHGVGALMYLDGANLNALLGIVRPGDMGFDLVHFNLHKTFSTPHGGGGPGAGPLGVREALVPYLPLPLVEKRGDRYCLDYSRSFSIGKVSTFYGNFGILVRAYSYIRRMGPTGLSAVSRAAILNANYVRKRLEGAYVIPYNRACMHECVVSAKPQKEKGVHAWDIAKRLIDYGFYPPTINFPLVVDEAMMIEPPETESKETLDSFCEAMCAIAREVDENPDQVTGAPHSRPIGRVDEVQAARQLNVRWVPGSRPHPHPP